MNYHLLTHDAEGQIAKYSFMTAKPELTNTVKLQCFEHLWNHENMFETGVVNHSARSRGIVGISFRFFLT